MNGTSSARSALLGSLLLSSLLVTSQAQAAGSVDIDPFILPPGGSVVIEFDVTIDDPTTPGATTVSNTGSVSGANVTTIATDDPDTGAVDDPTVTQLLQLADLSITKSDGATTEIPGTPVTYFIVASNAGPATDPNVTVTDTFPGTLTGCSWTSVAAGGVTGNDAGPVAGNINDTGISMPLGGSVTYTVTCDISSSATGTLVNTATIAASVSDPTPGNNSATDSNTLTPQADVAITKTDGATTEIPGTGVTYTLVASNAGPSADPAAVVGDTFPGILSSCSWTTAAAGGATGNDNGSGAALNDTINLPVGGSVTYTVNCTIAATATGSLTNTATVTPSVTDNTTNNNSATDIDTLTPQADISVTKTDGQTSDTPGTGIVYTIVVANAGPSTDPNLTLSDNFPAALTGCSTTSVAAGGATGNDAGPTAGNINDTGISLPPSSTVTYTATCTIDPAATGTLTNTAGSVASVTDPTLGNNSATDNTTLAASADLSITKTDGSATEVPGTTVTYTVVASNAAGPSTVNATVTDSFPVTLPVAGCSWTTVAAGGATGNDNGSGANLNDGIVLPTGGSVTYTITCTIDPAATGSLANTAVITTGIGIDSNSANNSATDTDALTPQADVAITKTNGVSSVVPGGTTTYTIVATNNGPSTATSVTVADTFPAALTGCSYTSAITGSGSGNDPGPTAGNINDGGISLAPSAFVTYTATCTVDSLASGTVANTATVTSGTTDPDSGNNSATDSDPVTPLDFGDAPDSGLGAFTYPVTLAQDGARHVIAGTLILGALRDNETDAVPSLAATSDDTTGSDDEDGVVFDTPVIACQTATLGLTAAVGGGHFSGWIDFNRDGDWNDANEQIADDVVLPSGPSTHNFNVPCDAVAGASYARFRLATATGLAFTGIAADGEVEDYQVTLIGLDFGDAPDSSLGAYGYPVTLANDGARHALTGAGLLNPASPDPIVSDAEANGQPSVTASLDDTTGVDDENGVTFGPLLRGQNATITVFSRDANTLLQGWIDWNADGDWNDAGEQVFTNQVLASAGANPLSVSVPGSVTPEAFTYARFRLTPNNPAYQNLAQTGYAAEGEVEDYRIQFAGIANLSITKTDGATTEVPGTTVVYTIVASNAGPSANPSVTVADTFPAILTGCSWTSVAAGGATGNDAGPIAGNINDTAIAMPAGSSVTYTATCTISPSATGSLSNTATVSGGGVSDENAGDNSATDTDTLTPQADLSVTKTDGQTSDVPGTTLTYTIVLTNGGPSTDPNVALADALPASLTSCSTTSVAAGGATGNDAGPTAGNVNDTGISMPPSSTVTYTVACTIDAAATGTVSNTATATASVTDPNPPNNSATDTTTLTPQADVSVTKTDGVGSEVPGTGVTYTIVAANAGPSADPAVVVADSFPGILTGCSWTTVAAGGATGNDNGSGAALNDTINLPAGGSVTYTVSCTIAATATGSLANTATVTASVTDNTTGNNSATDTDTLTPEADLSITKTDGQATEVPGTTVVYTVTASNAGPSHDPNATVTDTFPGILSGCSWTSVAAGGATGNDNGSAPSLNDGGLGLPPGGSVTYTITCTIAASATGSLSNTANVAGSVGDSNPGNNSATDTDTLAPEADLSITKVASDPVVNVGDPVTYTITVNNAGPSDATSVVVADALPAGLTFVSTTGCAEDPNGVPTCTLGTIAVGGSDAFTVDVTVNTGGSHINTASVSSAATDPDPSDNSDEATVATDVVPPEVVGAVEYFSAADQLELAACQNVRLPIHGLEVHFSEPMQASEGGSPGADDADNPDNYLLIAAGADNTLDTEDCAGVHVNDVEITGVTATYVEDQPVAGQSMVRLTYNDGHQLPNGLYRFLACGSTTLVDLVGNPLNGGEDFAVSFRVDHRNQLENGHFDFAGLDEEAAGCEAPWTKVPSATDIAFDDLDAQPSPSPHSGSMRITTTGHATQGIQQCVAIRALEGFGRAPYTLSGKVLVDELASGELIGVGLGCTYYAATDCSGAALGSQSEGAVIGDSGGLWLTRTLAALNPVAGTGSMRCGFTLDNPGPDALDVWLDRIQLIGTSPGGVQFTDGFELGNTSAWSAAVP